MGREVRRLSLFGCTQHEIGNGEGGQNGREILAKQITW